MTAEVTFIRESIEGDEQTTATFRTSPEVMADVTAYDPKELLAIFIQSRGKFSMSRKWVAIRLGTESRDKSLPVPTNYRCGVLNTNAQVPGQKEVLNIQKFYDDYCFL